MSFVVVCNRNTNIGNIINTSRLVSRCSTDCLLYLSVDKQICQSLIRQASSEIHPSNPQFFQEIHPKINIRNTSRLVSLCSTDRGDFMASRKVILLPPNISSFTCDQIFYHFHVSKYLTFFHIFYPLHVTKYFIIFMWPNILSFSKYLFPVTK